MAWITPKVNWITPDGVGYADLNRIEGNIQDLEDTKLDASEVATTATANKVIRANASGVIPASITGNAATATSATSAATLTTARTINGVAFNGSQNITVADSTKLPLAGGTMTGILVANTNTAYTTRQVQNVIESTADPSGGSNGDIWVKYKP